MMDIVGFKLVLGLVNTKPTSSWPLSEPNSRTHIPKEHGPSQSVSKFQTGEDPTIASSMDSIPNYQLIAAGVPGNTSRAHSHVWSVLAQLCESMGHEE